MTIYVDSWITLRSFQDKVEREFLVQVLRDNGWNCSATARQLDTPRSNLYRKLEQYKISEATDRA